MLKEFKEFVMRGNVVDLAIGIVIGAAFGKIVTSFVEDVLMPPIGLALGNVDWPSAMLISLTCSSTSPGAITQLWPRPKLRARRPSTMESFSILLSTF